MFNCRQEKISKAYLKLNIEYAAKLDNLNLLQSVLENNRGTF